MKKSLNFKLKYLTFLSIKTDPDVFKNTRREVFSVEEWTIFLTSKAEALTLKTHCVRVFSVRGVRTKARAPKG